MSLQLRSKASPHAPIRQDRRHLNVAVVSLSPSLAKSQEAQKKKKKPKTPHTGQKLLETQRNVPIPIIIISLEYIRHPLQTDTTLYKQIETHVAPRTLLIRPVQDPDKRRRKPVSERHERLGVLIETDIAAAILVEAVEEVAPGSEEGPEPAELIEVDRARLVDVEHANHHFYGVRVKGGPVAVDQGGTELFFSQLACAGLIDRFE